MRRVGGCYAILEAAPEKLVALNDIGMQLLLNETVWVQLLGTTEQARMTCSVTAVTPNRVTLRFDDGSSPPIGMEPGSSVALRVINAQGVHTATAEVAQVARRPHPAIALRAPIVFASTQKRRFVRVVVNAPVTFKVRKSSDPARVGLTDDQARCVDLSAGGMRLITATQLSSGDELELSVKLRHSRIPNGELNLVGRVLRLGPGDTKPRVTYAAGVELIHANQRAEDALVMLMFELDRKRLA
jgi:c-di-GMP-binding flagellar brake protein YcgR